MSAVGYLMTAAAVLFRHDLWFWIAVVGAFLYFGAKLAFRYTRDERSQ